MPSTYVVKEGDTLYAIARQNCPDTNLSDAVEQIAQDNQLTNPNLIYVGQVLTLNCAAGTLPPQPSGPLTHTVVAGDTLGAIAARYRDQCPGLTWSSIAQANSIPDPDLIHPGTVLIIPCAGGDRIILNVRYYSQNDRDSNLSSTDCGPACVRMMIGWNRRQQGQQEAGPPTVNDLWRATGVPAGGLVGIDTLINIASPHGLALCRQDSPSATISWIIDQIRARRPVIMLCHYGTIKPRLSAWTGGHFVVVVGFSPTEIFIHDPNWQGSPYRNIARDTFASAIGADNSLDGNPSNVGLYVC